MRGWAFGICHRSACCRVRTCSAAQAAATPARFDIVVHGEFCAELLTAEARPQRARRSAAVRLRTWIAASASSSSLVTSCCVSTVTVPSVASSSSARHHHQHASCLDASCEDHASGWRDMRIDDAVHHARRAFAFARSHALTGALRFANDNVPQCCYRCT